MSHNQVKGLQLGNKLGAEPAGDRRVSKLFSPSDYKVSAKAGGDPEMGAITEEFDVSSARQDL